MRRDYQIAILLGLSAFPTGIALMAAPYYAEALLKQYAAGCFWAGLGLTVILLVAAIVLALKGEASEPQKGHRRRMVALAGMVISGACFVAFAAAYFWPGKSGTSSSSTAVTTPPAVQPNHHLIRTLSYDDLGIQIINKGGKAIIGHFSGRIQNVGQDSLMVDIKNLTILVGDKEIFSGPLAIEHYMSPGRGVDFSAMTIGRNNDDGTHSDVDVPPGTKDITEELHVEYDTASPSGLRRSYRKVVYPLTWLDGKCTAARGRIIEAKEN